MAVSECGHDHTEEIRAAHRRAAETVISASPADRAALNERASLTLESAKQAWPDISTDDLQAIFQTQAMMIDQLSRMDVVTLASALEAIFTNLTLASASLAGAYDLNDGEAPKRNLEDLANEAREARDKREAELNRNTGQFL